MTDMELNRALALLVVRIIGGMLFFFQGYDKIVKIGIKEVAETFRSSLSKTFLKGSALITAVYISSFIEMAGGAILLTGIGRDYILYLLAFNMAGIAFVFSLIKPMWDMQFYFPRLVLVISLLLLPEEWDIFTIYNLF